MSALLEVRDLVVRFGGGRSLASLVTGRSDSIAAVAGTSFAMAEGETFALVGESGSGKTTLARALIGLTPVASGSVLFQGQSTLGLAGAALKRLHRDIAMIFQDPVGSLSPRFTVRGLLAEPFRIHGLADRDLDAEVERLLGLVGLPRAMADRLPHQLSGGQARRVGVARAIALSPKLVIADEPTAGLDVSVQGEVLNLLNDLRETLGLSMLIITHNLNVVRHVADRMAIMYLGRFVRWRWGRPRRSSPAPAIPMGWRCSRPIPSPFPTPGPTASRWKARCRASSTARWAVSSTAAVPSVARALPIRRHRPSAPIPTGGSLPVITR